MSIIIVTGSQPEWCDFTSHQLEQAGVKPSEVSSRSDLGVQEIVEKIYAANGFEDQDFTDTGVKQIDPGKAWQIAAADVFVANSSYTNWGWAHPKNICLLDFWRDFDPQTKFVLVYGTPQESLANAISSENRNSTCAEQFLERWRNYHTELLRFYQHNRDRSILVHINGLRDPQQKWISQFNDKFGTRICQPESASVFPTSPVVEILSRHLLQISTEADELLSELDSAAEIPQDDSPESNAYYDAALADYKSAVEARSAYLDMEKELQNTRVMLTEAEAEIENLVNQKPDPASVSNQGLSNLKKENELLLFQMHQVQEELERYFNKYQALKNDNSEPLEAKREQTRNADADSKTLPQKPRRDHISIDLRSHINGTGWHNAEDHGRWAGLDSVSTIDFPGLRVNDYRMTLNVIDAMAVDIVRELKLQLDGNDLPFKIKLLSATGGRFASLRRLKAELQKIEKPFPIEISAHIPSRLVSEQSTHHQLKIVSPRTISPVLHGQQDTRNLSICVSTIEIAKLR